MEREIESLIEKSSTYSKIGGIYLILIYLNLLILNQSMPERNKSCRFLEDKTKSGKQALVLKSNLELPPKVNFTTGMTGQTSVEKLWSMWENVQVC